MNDTQRSMRREVRVLRVLGFIVWASFGLWFAVEFHVHGWQRLLWLVVIVSELWKMGDSLLAYRLRIWDLLELHEIAVKALAQTAKKVDEQDDVLEQHHTRIGASEAEQRVHRYAIDRHSRRIEEVERAQKALTWRQ